MKKTRGVVCEKEKLSFKVISVAKDCKNLGELSEKLKKESLLPYHRKDLLAGVWLGNRKFRLTTLGISKEQLQKLMRKQQRLDEINQECKNEDREK